MMHTLASLNTYNGVNFSCRHAGVLVYILYVAVLVQGINMTPNVESIKKDLKLFSFFLFWTMMEV